MKQIVRFFFSLFPPFCQDVEQCNQDSRISIEVFTNKLFLNLFFLNIKTNYIVNKIACFSNSNIKVHLSFFLLHLLFCQNKIHCNEGSRISYIFFKTKRQNQEVYDTFKRVLKKAIFVIIGKNKNMFHVVIS